MTKGDADAVVRRMTATLARRRLCRLGLPEGVARAVGSLFGGRLEPAEAGAVARAEAVRASVTGAAGGTVLDFKSGGERRHERRPEQLAEVSSIPRAWGVFLHVLASATAAERILELGSCVGVSASFLASARSCRRFVGVEGSAELAERARVAVRGIRPDAELLDGLFDERLDDAAALLEGSVDLAFVDGERRHDALPALLGRVASVARPGAVVVVDDVRYTQATWGAWRDVATSAWCAHALDLGRMGLVVVGDGPGQVDSLARFTGLWVVRRRT